MPHNPPSPDTVWYEYRRGGATTVLLDAFGPCFQCGGPTNTLDVDFETWLHQGVCALEADAAYWAWATAPLS